ncbi:MAG: glycosyltransferase family A protein [Thermoanaerobaculia bacterium]|nr:glycosyltransferase family A protein [Thermoanaerobaculia bacterium]
MVIPTHDRRELLPRALESVLDQTRLPGEVLVVDDGSTDGTAELVRSRYPSVRLLTQENRGVSAARNAGIEASSFPWIAFLDSDDAWRPAKLERQLQALDREDRGRRIGHTDEIWIRNGRRVNPGRRHRKRGGRIFEQCLELCAMSPSSVILHRSLLEEVGSFDEDLPACEDYDLWLRITCREPVLLVEEPLVVKHGGHEDQLSRQPALDRYRIRALEKLLATAPLSRDQRRAALETILEKLEIYLAGAAKRGRHREVRSWTERRRRWAAELGDLPEARSPEVGAGGKPSDPGR